MAKLLFDPFDFNDDDYVPSRENDFSESFMERVFGGHGKKRKADPSR